VRVGATAVTVFTAYLHVDRTVAKGKCCQRELLARLCFAWNVSAVVFYELSNKGWRHDRSAPAKIQTCY
jgi:hypothetical protein